LHACTEWVGSAIQALNRPTCLPRSVAGTPTNIQFDVKDSKKYASTGGWGFAQFKDGKPADKTVHETCFPCHELVKARDFVFTHYSPTP